MASFVCTFGGVGGGENGHQILLLNINGGGYLTRPNLIVILIVLFKHEN